MPMEPGIASERLLLREARCGTEVVTLDGAGVALPMEVPCTSTSGPRRTRRATETVAPAA